MNGAARESGLKMSIWQKAVETPFARRRVENAVAIAEYFGTTTEELLISEWYVPFDGDREYLNRICDELGVSDLNDVEVSEFLRRRAWLDDCPMPSYYIDKTVVEGMCIPMVEGVRELNKETIKEVIETPDRLKRIEMWGQLRTEFKPVEPDVTKSGGRLKSVYCTFTGEVPQTGTATRNATRSIRGMHALYAYRLSKYFGITIKDLYNNGYPY